MDILTRSTQHPATWAAGLMLALAIAAYIVATRQPAPHVGPCHPERWKLACSRWEAAGWPSCADALPGVSYIELTAALTSEAPRDDLRGAVVRLDDGTRAVAVRSDSCGDSDPTTEHEQGHARGLGHGGPTGSVMASPWERTGLAIPDAPQ